MNTTDLGYTYLTAEQDVLAGLWHGTIGSSHHEDGTVHLRSTRHHVLHIVSVAWAIHVCVVTGSRRILHVCGVDGDTALFFLGCVIDGIEAALLDRPFSASTVVIAAVSVVLPWSTWPIVPMLTCGLSLLKVSFAMVEWVVVLFCSSFVMFLTSLYRPTTSLRHRSIGCFAGAFAGN
jgi:hypothetical protein